MKKLFSFSHKKKAPSKEGTMPHIVHIDHCKRIITVIDGKPFYKSTGRNSGIKNTWLPFLGLITEPYSQRCLLKPSAIYDHHLIPVKYIEMFGDIDDSTWRRFHSIECMIFSALMGDGIWKTKIGAELNMQLQSDYENEYASAKSLITGLSSKKKIFDASTVSKHKKMANDRNLNNELRHIIGTYELYEINLDSISTLSTKNLPEKPKSS